MTRRRMERLLSYFPPVTTARSRIVPGARFISTEQCVDADFDSLEIGSEVRFADESGDKGPQASTVHLIGKRHIVG